ncbi:MAG TPA: hypothetical protein VGO50_06950 [Pyrinomonadaceae bacterium]|jgi:hypothetical protein|nr:hypothetical protein [Pyrinomonadaceae bacterium]
MNAINGKESKFVVCVNNSDYPASLELHKIYLVLPDKEAEEDGDLRVVDESGEDYLYSADKFCHGRIASGSSKFLAKSCLIKLTKIIE